MLPTDAKPLLSLLSDSEWHSESLGMHFWKTDDPLKCLGSGTCTVSALIIARQLGGKVFGYRIEEADGGVVGHDAGGHDFAVVKDVIIDWWGAAVEDTPAIVRIGSSEAQRLYLPQERWIPVTARLADFAQPLPEDGEPIARMSTKVVIPLGLSLSESLLDGEPRLYSPLRQRPR